MKNKKIYLEILRIISCFFVIARHTNGFVLNSVSNNKITWLITVLYHILSMISVPVFFMISGSLLLNKEYSYKQMLKKSFSRLFLPLLFFSAIIYFKRYPMFSLQNIFEFISQLLNNKILSTYWFIYVLIGLYIATPFLQKMCKNFEAKDYKAFLIFTIIFVTIIPIFKRYGIFSITTEFSIPLVSIYVAYYIIGNFVFNYEWNLERKHEISLLVGSIAILIFGMVMTYYDHTNLNLNDYYYGGISRITVFIPSITISYFIKKIYEKKEISEKNKKIILYFSGCTFGIYLLHTFLLDNLKFVFDFMVDTMMFNQFIAIILYQFILFFILVVIVKILKKIPILNKFI